jgi:hypothetical protein
MPFENVICIACRSDRSLLSDDVHRIAPRRSQVEHPKCHAAARARRAMAMDETDDADGASQPAYCTSKAVCTLIECDDTNRMSNLY